MTIEQRTRLMLDAAGKLFGEKGYANTSINDLIAVTGGSKATLAKQFRNKAGLFAAIIGTFATEFVVSIEGVGAGDDPEKGLEQIGLGLLKFYLRREAVEAYRGIISVGPRERDLAVRFYREGHLRIIAPVAAALRLWHAMGLVDCTDPDSIADKFAHMLRNGPYEQVLLGMRRTVPPQEIRAQARLTARILYAGITPRTR